MIEELKDFIEEVKLPNWYVNFDKPLTLDDYHKKVLPILKQFGCKSHRNEYKPWSSNLSKTEKNVIRGGIRSISRYRFKNVAQLSNSKIRVPIDGSSRKRFHDILNFTVLTEEEFFNIQK